MRDEASARPVRNLFFTLTFQRRGSVPYTPTTDRPEDRSPPPADASSPMWPVLARLPWVGQAPAAHGEHRVTYSEPQAEDAGRREAYSPTTLRIAETPADLQRAYVDRAHRASEPRIPNVQLRNDEPVIHESPSRQRLHRVDSGDARKFAALAAGLRNASPTSESLTLASRIFQWHAALAPYAGVVLTFLLAFSAGLLYWATFGRPQANHSTGGAFEATPLWTSESLDPTTIGQNDWQTPAVAQDAAEFSWSQTAASDKAELAVESAATAKSEPLEPEPLQPEPSKFTQIAVDDAPAPGEPLTAATAAPLSIAYPTTPIASFDFGLTPTANDSATDAGQTSQGVVAGLPDDATTATPSTR